MTQLSNDAARRILARLTPLPQAFREDVIFGAIEVQTRYVLDGQWRRAAEYREVHRDQRGVTQRVSEWWSTRAGQVNTK